MPDAPKKPLVQSSDAFKRTTVSAALPYANGPLHIGHLAGVYIPSDIYVRYLRLMQRDVLFVCGSDEHGVAITIRARKEGISPAKLVERYHTMNQATFAHFGVAFDHYSRTSLDVHHKTAQQFFKDFDNAGKLLKKESEQYYDTQEEMFLPDRYLVGTCPVCGHTEAYGDQCEKCGASLSPTDLIQPRSAISGATPELRTTTHYFLPLDAYQDWLEQFILEDHKEWKSNVYGQCKSWLDAGLQSRAITRDLNWGVDVPAEGTEGKKLYVWFDAPIGYISASKAWAAEQGEPELWQRYWKKQPDEKDNARLIHFIGKDNIVFHCIIFPTILHGQGEYIVPDNVPANEFMNLEGKKISTSRNWAVWGNEFAEEHPDKIDVMRYVLTAGAPETQDADFSWEEFLARNNNELVAIFGNFVNRVLTLTKKYYDNVVPTAGHYDDADEKALAAIKVKSEHIASSIEQFRFREAVGELMDLARAGNRYLADQEPWHVWKTDQARTGTILFVGLQVAAALATACEPFMPHTAEKLRRMMNLDKRHWAQLSTLKYFVEAGHELGKAELLFQKLDQQFVEAQQDKLKTQAKPETEVPETTATAAMAPIKDEIEFDDFVKLDLRIATITAAEKLPKADKLLKLTLNVGEQTRTVLSGIAKHYDPADLPGTQVVLVANLKPRKMRGVLSEGMVLMAEDASGKLMFVSPEAAIASGAEVR